VFTKQETIKDDYGTMESPASTANVKSQGHQT